MRDALAKKLRPIGSLNHDPADYDRVVLGTPVWAGTMATAVRTFLADHGARLPEVAFFCTLAGKNPAHTFEHMAAASGRTPLATVALRAKDVKAGRHAEALKGFAERLAGPASP